MHVVILTQLEKAPQGTNLWGTYGGARTGRVTGTRSKAMRNLMKGVYSKIPGLNFEMDPTAPVKIILESDVYSSDTWLYSTLQEKLAKIFFPPPGKTTSKI